MILIREVQECDLDALVQFAEIPGFINLSQDREVIAEKIKKSQESFAKPEKTHSKFIFVAESNHGNEKKVIGTSMIATQHGTQESPHFYFEVSKEERFSKTINTGFIHGTLRLRYDSNGPSEVGGLVIKPEWRNTSEKIGRQLSFVRFAFLGLNRSIFRSNIIAELLPPLNKKGQSPLWEAIGRRFTNMDYWEADQLCQKNKEFILTLFPSGKIYTSFLPAEAKNAIGKVGKDTLPVYHMLTKLGFRYKNQVDPFDGGPHLWAHTDDLFILKHLKKVTLLTSQNPAPLTEGLLCQTQKQGFRAIQVKGQLQSDSLLLTPELYNQAQALLQISQKTPLVFMPHYHPTTQ